MNNFTNPYKDGKYDPLAERIKPVTHDKLPQQKNLLVNIFRSKNNNIIEKNNANKI